MTKLTSVSKIEIARKKDGTAIQGKSRAGEWSLWNLYDADNVKYGVFESVLGKEVKVGDSVLLNFTEESWVGKDGKGGGLNRNLTDVTKVDSGALPSQGQPSVNKPVLSDSVPNGQSKNEGLELLREIKALCQEILARIP